LDSVDAVYSGKDVLRSFDDGKEVLSELYVPRLFDTSDAHQRLFVANFDGTGNDAVNDPEHITNVGRFDAHLMEIADPRIGRGYVNGPGTDGSRAKRLVDNVWGVSHDERVRRMYARFAEEAARWIRDDPQADIRVLVTGFSRGAEEAASFTRMLHDRGIEIETASGRLRLRDHGATPQAVVLYDPVGTGHPRAHDRRLPPSVVSGIQIVAGDERRTQFPSSTIIRQGISRDSRFLGITVPGAHSDVGGSYHNDGLARATEALAADYINSLAGDGVAVRPKLSPHIYDYDRKKSEQHEPFYTTGMYERLGMRDTRGPEAHAGHCRVVVDCAPPEPVDQALLERLGPKHPVNVGPTPLDAIGRDVAIESPPLPAHAQYAEDQKAARTEETRADIARRDLDPQASWADHYQSTFPPAEERDHRVDFSKSPWLEPGDGSRKSLIEAPHPEQTRSSNDMPELSSRAEPSRSSPAHPHHRDHALYQSVHDQLTTLHAEEGITLSDQQMERLAHCSVAQARRCGLTQVTHMGLGQDKQGNIEPEVHMYQAFRGDLDDPRTKWGKVDALEAFQTPVATASQDLQMANLQWDQMAQDRQMQLSQQQEQGMSMSR
jgi:hypothetical protein